MRFDIPAALDLTGLFRESPMFNSRGTWESEGFQVFDRSDNGKIMVARHPAVQGVLFKKYSNDIAQKAQSKNFARRIEGSNRLRAFCTKEQLRHIAVPRKWLWELPRTIWRKEKTHILVVEELALLNDEATRAAYGCIDPSVLRELCFVLFHFRGMDSNAKNMPFVADGRLAFVDTEHWDRGSSKAYLHHVRTYMSVDRRKLAEKIFDQLDDGEGRANVDFDDEEDTSSSSSSS